MGIWYDVRMVKDDFGPKTSKGPVDPRLLERQRIRRERLGVRRPLSDGVVKAAVRRAEEQSQGTKQPVIGGVQELKKENVFYPEPLSVPEVDTVIRLVKEREGDAFGSAARHLLNSFVYSQTLNTTSRWSMFAFTNDSDAIKTGEQPYIKKNGYNGVRLQMEGERKENGQITIRMYLYPIFTFVDELGRPWPYDGYKGPTPGKDEVYTRAWNNIPKSVQEQGIFCGTLVYNADGTLAEDNNDLI